MKKEEEAILETLEKFLDHRLSREEHQQIEQRLQWDEQWSSKLMVVKEARQLMIGHELMAVKSLIKDADKEFWRHHQRTKLFKWFTVSLIILIGFAVFFYFLRNKSSDTISNGSSKTTVPVTSERNRIPNPTSNIVAIPSASKDAGISPVKKEKNTNSSIPDMLKVKDTVQSSIDTFVEATSIEVAKVPSENIPKKDISLEHPSSNHVADVCSNVHLTAQINTTETCFGENEGTIQIDDVSGGAQPYRYILNKQRTQEIPYFNDLSPGNYSVILMDANGCASTVENIRIVTKDCKVHYSIHPLLEEYWTVPPFTEDVQLNITDKAGGLYYSKKISKGSGEIWDGRSSGGQIIPGLYLYTIESNGKVLQQGSITISHK